MQSPDEFTHASLIAASANGDKFAEGFGVVGVSFVMRFEQRIERVVFDLMDLRVRKNRELRIKLQPLVMEMFADELETKAVDRGDVRRVEQRELLIEVLGRLWISGG